MNRILLLLLSTVSLAQQPLTQPPQRVCNSILKPAWPHIVTPNGFTVQPGIKPTEDNRGTLEQDYVRDTVGVDCWKLGWVRYVAIVRAPDLGSVHEPVYRKGEEPVEKKP